MATDPAVIDWLLDTDPALRWQVERDLVGAPESVWRATRARVATEGFGARLLARQDADGQWAGGAYFPGAGWSHPDVAPEDGQPWVATTWSLNQLREWGVDPALLGDTAERLAANSRWEYHDLPYWGGEVDCCINAFTLANGLWLGADVERLRRWFVEHRLADGGWNCEWVEGSTRSSFHSTLNSLHGLLAAEEATGEADDELLAARRGGEEYLLSRELLHRSDGAIVGDWVDDLASPLRWRYSALRATDYLRRAAVHDGTPPDPRAAEAVERVRAARQPDGRWLQHGREPGMVWFETDAPAGAPSTWLTFVATRMLDWWDGARA